MSPQGIVARASPRITSLISRRAFHATRSRLSSPYHYPEGPRSNLPFNTKTRFFAVRYWLYCITGFFSPFAIAGASSISSSMAYAASQVHAFLQSCCPDSGGYKARRRIYIMLTVYSSLANQQAQGLSTS
ncbi:hypothetical protein GGS21DRAFT_344892 [Xylaria nigripes]|nr:hypothetical protein GGS21DRAFT_344892 [Xylaria nigripes]